MRLVSSDMHRVMINHGNAAVRSVCLTGDAFFGTVAVVCSFCRFRYSDSDQLLVRIWFLEYSFLSRFVMAGTALDQLES